MLLLAAAILLNDPCPENAHGFYVRPPGQVSKMRTLTVDNVLKRFPMPITRGAESVYMTYPGSFTPHSQTLPERRIRSERHLR
jgi:hypothetical protein